MVLKYARKNGKKYIRKNNKNNINKYIRKK